MASVTKFKGYLRVRRLIDHDLANRPRAPLTMLSLMPTIFMASAVGLVSDGGSLLAWLIVMAPLALWAGFVLWRVVRMVRAAGIKGDRQYDQQDRSHLPPEYLHTESTTAASQRKRRSQQR